MILSGQTETHDHMRKFMNGAVYIESCLSTDKIKRNFSAIDAGRKRISCSCSNDRLCKIHENLLICKRSNESLDYCSSASDVSVYDENDSKAELSTIPSTTKESRTTIISFNNASSFIGEHKEGHFKSWVQRKEEEKRRILEHQILLEKKKEKEKEIRLEQERENFKRWLANKKREKEHKEQKQKLKTMHQETIKEQQKTLKAKENDLTFKLWCKKKEEKELERKLKDTMDEIRTSEAKDRKLEENRRAYRNWLRLSVNKPTPIPLGKGLESLRASLSVTYVNPIPWQPNIDVNQLNSV